jgi:hypothetical protein
METARADSLLAEESLNKLKLAIIKDLTASQVQPDGQNNEFPESRQTRGESPILPRRASKSPDHSRAPYEIVDYPPAKGRTSRSPTQKGMANAPIMPGHRGESPSGYRVDRCIDLRRKWPRICAINGYWRVNKNPLTKRMILFNALFSNERIRDIEESYAKTEDFAFLKDDALHPFYR